MEIIKKKNRHKCGRSIRIVDKRQNAKRVISLAKGKKQKQLPHSITFPYDCMDLLTIHM